MLITRIQFKAKSEMGQTRLFLELAILVEDVRKILLPCSPDYVGRILEEVSRQSAESFSCEFKT